MFDRPAAAKFTEKALDSVNFVNFASKPRRVSHLFYGVFAGCSPVGRISVAGRAPAE
jgi:hypothetical protein